MEKLYVCYLMNNIVDDIDDIKQNINLNVSEKGAKSIDKRV
jgi:hypothetical protein